MQPQALTLVVGTVLGVRTVKIEATPATETAPGRDASEWREADVATDHARYDGTLVQGVTATIPVTLNDTDPTFAAGDRVNLLVYPYATFRKYGNGPARKTVAHRFVHALPSQPAAERVAAHA